MNALIDLTKCREYMTINIGGKNHQVKLSGTINEPYFCGRDVCEVLGYEAPLKALQRYVEDEDKNILSNIMVTCNHTLGKENFSFREGQNIFISETGLYSLILSSQAPFAKEFKRLVCKIILPSIRKYGSYQVESQLSLAMEQLAIKDTELEQEKEARVKAERKAIRINKFMKRITIKENKAEWIYIATTKFYSRERIFKPGSTIRLSSRIGPYNTGRPVEDAYYYCWAMRCYNSKDVDYHIQKLLADFKHKDNAELVVGIKFFDLKDILTFIVNNYDASVDYINNFIRTRMDASLEEEDEPPPRLDYKRFTVQIGEHTETIDLEEEESDSVREAFEDILLSLKEQEDSEMLVLQRKDLMTRLSNKTNAPKKDLWYQIKELTGWTNSKTEINDGGFKYKIVY
jgi:prophage antirepressor-like protein